MNIAMNIAALLALAWSVVALVGSCFYLRQTNRHIRRFNEATRQINEANKRTEEATRPDGRHYMGLNGDLATRTVRVADDGNPPPTWLVQPTGDPRQAIVDAAIAWRNRAGNADDWADTRTRTLIGAIDKYQETAQ